ncbi:hypothetical protein AAV35_004425 [Salimicrobium jeotgali]|uniref:YvrJ family protein n=1 Tax=Salimicrobium jeotgali TaxID=1230341 RepID=K2FJK2_9BACI|nr:YvrJ family protein [Salimicrobium jeotgali]AKG04103.1 hypothetical protein AAV35_004425 [Salimicrobium jeotgali]EKE31231.1 hypothetical protein MJ3_09683 [Salimicrobium jeotgali]MBM7697206.1 hypothetical protein [Salimicrobium jeotgali]
MDPNTWLSLIGNLGFPIVVTFYLLTRLEKNFKQIDERGHTLSRTPSFFNLMIKILHPMIDEQ